MMPVEATSVLGALEGIRDLFSGQGKGA
jgi:hypothetical protein